jgi:hypothetical protein
MTVSPCRACQAPIGFIHTPTGRSMPVDAELVKTRLRAPAIGDKSRPLALVTEQGQVIRGVESEQGEPVEGYRVHWASCTKPEQFRKP